MPKKISPEVKARAVRMVREHQQDYPSVTAAALAVAKQLGLGRETVRRWVVQAEVDGGGRPGVTSEDHAEIKRLKAENRRLREDVEILQAATTFFAGALDPRSR
jgi:transposase